MTTPRQYITGHRAEFLANLDQCGFVFQSGQLAPELTAEENVALPLLWSCTRRGRGAG